MGPLGPTKGTSLKMSVVQHIQAMFGQGTFNVPKNATNTIYVEGIPTDSTEREVSRKLELFLVLVEALLPWSYVV